MTQRILILGLGVVLLSACARIIPQPPEPSESHLRAEQAPPRGEIPSIAEEAPFLPPPQPAPALEKYTVVVHEVPVKDLLFAVARDANMNVDVDPKIEGLVTLNAVDQTLPQILDRVARQVDIRYEIRDKTIIVSPDAPYFRTYKVDYVNMSREATSTSSVATQISTTGGMDVGVEGGGGGGGLAGGGGGGLAGGGGNNSTTEVKSTSNHRFWLTIAQNIMAIVGEKAAAAAASGQVPTSENVVVNPESGVINVRATSKQHEQIQAFVDSVMVNAQRQVLIEATVVEVELNDAYQFGIDWALIARGAGFSFLTNLNPRGPFPNPFATDDFLKDPTTIPPFITGIYNDRETDYGAVNVTTQLLKRFGDLRVLSSPKLMVLNNQTAMLKVVDNVVYFTVTSQQSQAANTGTLATTQTDVHTVPVGFIMAVTPQIRENTVVTMNVRPTISRVQRFVPVPNLVGDQQQVTSQIPQIQVREMESVLKVNSGQIAILGGLMQESVRRESSGMPGAGDMPIFGELFKRRDNESVNTELVIFLRPIVIQNASIDGDLQDYRPFLDYNRYEQFTPQRQELMPWSK